MIPKLNGIDHVHLSVKNREVAAVWYEKVLGFKIIGDMKFWADSEYGPLNIEDASGKIHIALFNSKNFSPTAAIAFKATGKEFIEWKNHLEKEGILQRYSDFDIAWSLYFNDLDGNTHEITTFDHTYVAGILSDG